MKIPLITQIQVSDNGAAALAMMLGCFGRYVTLKEMRQYCISSRNGSDADQICRAADHYHLVSEQKEISVEELMNTRLPLMIGWKKKYFAVLSKLTPKKAVIYDPSKGRITVTLEKFKQSFTGRAVFLTPGEGFETGGKLPGTITLILSRLQGYKKWLLLLSFFSAALVFLNMGYLYFKRGLIDDVMSKEAPDKLLAFSVGLGGLLLLRFAILIIDKLVNSRVSRRMAAVSGAKIYKKLLHLPLSFYEKVSRGEIMDRLSANTVLDQNILTSLAPKVFNVAALVLYLIMLYSYNVLLSSILIAIHLLLSLCILAVQRRMVTANRSIVTSNETLRSSLMNTLNDIDSIKASGSERRFFQLWNDQMNESIQNRRGMLGLDSLHSLLQTVQSVAESATLLILGAFLIIRGHLTMGMLSVIQSVFSSVTSTVSGLLSTSRQLQTMRTSIDRINDLQEREEVPEVLLKPDEMPDKLSGAVNASHLSFRYNEGDAPALTDVSLTIAPGEMVALVGKSGCGKSTLMKLIAGMYEVQEGSILYDGKKRAEIPDTVFYSSVGCVDQDINMFADTVRNNLKMWDSSVEDYEMILAARDAQIHDRILKNHEGYDAMILGNGRNYSGGEQQRLELARALSAETSLLILDEFTSALDAATEDKVFRAIRDKRTTCLIAAHRLSTIVGCDRIVVIDSGRIVEEGTHEALYAAKGLYYELLSLS